MIRCSMPAASAASIKMYPSFAVVGKNHSLWPAAVRTFQKRIAPIYGDQNKALHQIEADASDRTLEFLHLNQPPNEGARQVQAEVDGVLLYKNVPTDEYKQYGLENSLEVKTLCLLPEAPNGRGGGSYLMERAMQVARAVGADTLHLTVNSNAQDNPRMFFKKKFGFIEKASWPTKYGQEYLLYLEVKPSGPVQVQPTPVPAGEASRTMPEPAQPQSSRKRRLAEPAAEQAAPEPEQLRRRRFGQHHKITLKGPYIRYIRQGRKTVEGRLNSGLMTNIRQDDTITFYNTKEAVDVHVRRITAYPSFAEMLTKVGVTNVLPEYTDVQAAVNLFHSFPRYQEKAGRNGVLAIHVALLNG